MTSVFWQRQYDYYLIIKEDVHDNDKNDIDSDNFDNNNNENNDDVHCADIPLRKKKPFLDVS